MKRMRLTPWTYGLALAGMLATASVSAWVAWPPVGRTTAAPSQQAGDALRQEVLLRCGAAVVEPEAAVWQARVDEPTDLSDYDWTYLRVSRVPHEWSQLALRRKLDGELFIARMGGPLGVTQRFGPVSFVFSCRSPQPATPHS
ncbi:MAG: hypothetical protein E6Q67_15070 [Roseateles sp.]|nr:MAG: hypothetical protein E6Q67_15070 [Roseateles sp.]